jgi:hypothetical protein
MGVNKRSGILSVMNAIYLDVVTKKPLLVMDTLKTSSIENTSQKQEIRGGQGNKKLMSFEYGREAILKMQDALISDQSLALLAGQAVETTATLFGREILTVDATKEVALANEPITGSVTVFKTKGGLLQEEITGFTVTESDVVLTSATPTVAQGDSVQVIYQYVSTSTNLAKVTFNAEVFPHEFAVVGDCIMNGDDGVPYKAQFYIARAKLQSEFTITLEAENPSTFDFNLDILASAENGDLYTITRY